MNLDAVVFVNFEIFIILKQFILWSHFVLMLVLTF